MSFFGNGILGSAMGNVLGSAMDSFLSTDEVNTQPIPSFYFEVDFFEADKFNKAKISTPKAAAGGASAIGSNMLSGAASMLAKTKTLNPGEFDKEWYLKAFVEVSGIEMGVETEQKNEGGYNFPIDMPTKMKSSHVTLKRLYRPASIKDKWSEWVQETLDSLAYWKKPIKTHIVQINIMHPNLSPEKGETYILHSIELYDAYPVRVSYTPLNSTSEDLLYQEIEISYSNSVGGYNAK